MYEEFFNLKECPFKLPPDPGYLFLSNQHKLALVHLEYGLTHRAGFIVITGEIGTGKTTLIKTMLQRMSHSFVVASIFNTTVGPDEFLNLILDDFELPYNESDIHTFKLEKLKTFLIKLYAEGKKAVLIVDEAQNLSMETLEEIRLLSNFQTAKDYLIHIFLVGQPELRQKLTHPSLRQLAQRISVHYHINALSGKETEGYVSHRLKVSGAVDTGSCFSPEAIEEIYSQTKGVPRLVNLLCDACLVNAFADQIKPVTRRIVLETVKGDGAGNFWKIASTDGYIDVPPTPAGVETQIPDAAVSDQITSIASRLSELEKTVQVLSRLFNEKLIEGVSEKNKGPGQGKTMLYLLEREQKKVIALSLERKRLQEKLDKLSRSLSQHKTEDTTTSPEPEHNFFARILGMRSKNAHE